MKKYLIIIILNLGFTTLGQNCSMLKDGRYYVEFDEMNRSSNTFEIIENHYYVYENGVKKDYEIKMLGECSFEIVNNEKVDESKLSETQRLLSKQKAFFEITKVEGNVYYFVCRIDLHVQCGSGKFLRKG